MKRVITFIMLTVTALGCAGEEKAEQTMREPQQARNTLGSPAEVYLDRVLACLAHTENIIPDMTAAADDAAARVVDGGRIFVTDDETIFRTGDEETQIVKGGGYSYPMHRDWGGFVAEACDRAGGLRHIQPVPVRGELTDRDVVLAATMELNPEHQIRQFENYRKQGALVILFGSRDTGAGQAADYIIDNSLEPGIVPVMTIDDTAVTGPVAGIANVINMWAFTAEFVAAVTRQGTMPTLWQSMFVPGAAQRNERIGKDMFHDDLRIMPVEKGILGIQFTTAIGRFLTGIRQNELDRFREAGKICAETISGGGKVVASIIGHFMASQSRMPSYPDIFNVRDNQYGTDQLEGVLDAVDVWLHVGYSYYPERELKYALGVGAKTVCVFTPGPTDIGEGVPIEPDMSLIDLYIDPCWKHGDAVVEVPDYDTKIIPPSGVVMITCWWMLLGETMAELKSGR